MGIRIVVACASGDTKSISMTPEKESDLTDWIAAQIALRRIAGDYGKSTLKIVFVEEAPPKESVVERSPAEHSLLSDILSDGVRMFAANEHAHAECTEKKRVMKKRAAVARKQAARFAQARRGQKSRYSAKRAAQHGRYNRGRRAGGSHTRR